MLVIGVGQEFQGDDAAGLLAVRHVGQLALPGVTIREVTGDLLGLLEMWSGEANVIVIDAVSAPAPAGTIWRWEAHAAAVPAELSGAGSPHGWGLAQTVALGRLLGCLPPRLIIFGITGEDFSRGAAVNPAVTAATRQIGVEVKGFLREINPLGGHPRS